MHTRRNRPEPGRDQISGRKGGLYKAGQQSEWNQGNEKKLTQPRGVGCRATVISKKKASHENQIQDFPRHFLPEERFLFAQKLVAVPERHAPSGDFTEALVLIGAEFNR